MEKWIIVTGAAGFIGSGVLRQLNSEGHTRLLAVDHLGSDERWKNLVGKRFRDIIEPGDLFHWLEENGQDVGAVMHLGACSSTVEKDAAFLLENNYRYSRHLAEWAIETGVRFIYASSAATYGDGSRGFSDDHALLHDLEPLNMYGYSKHLFDLWALDEGILDQMVGLKFFNVFGPNEAHKGRMASALTHLLPQVQKEGKVRLFRSSEPEKFGDGEQSRDFIYVKDAARMACAFLRSEGGGIFNIGAGEASSWNTLATSLFEACGQQPQIEYIPMPEDLLGKYQNYTCADMQKTKLALGMEAGTQPLPQAVKEYVCRYLLPAKRW